MSYIPLSPYVRVALHDIQTTKFCFDRTIWDYELIYIEKGNMKVTYDNEVYNCIPGDFILLRPRVHHILSSNGEEVIQPHIHFDLIQDELSPRILVSFVLENKMTKDQLSWFRKDILPACGFDLPPVIRLNDSIVIKDTLYQIINEFNYKKPLFDYTIQSLVIKLLTDLNRSYTNQINLSLYGKHVHTMEGLIKFIYKNVDKSLSLDELSEYANLSKFYLSRLFKNTYGIPPHTYIDQLRLKRAKELIQLTELSMQEISEKMNFADQQTFSRWFKKNDGFTPLKYRIKRL